MPLMLCLFFSPLGALVEEKVDVIVLGGGVGGLTSSIYLARSGLKTTVLEGSTPGGAITQSEGIQNWPGELDISGSELIDKIRTQALKNGVTLCGEEVIKVDFSSDPFSFLVQDVYDPTKQRTVLADACIIAMGSKARTLGVEGEKEYWSRGVYTCAVCDGPLYRDKIVAVVGGGDAAILEASYLSRIASKVYVIVRGNALKGVEKQRALELIENPKVQILYQTQVQSIKGSTASVEKIELINQEKEKTDLTVQAVFLALGSIPNTQLFTSQLELDEKGYIKQRNHCETSKSRVFAIGDVADPVFQQVISAAGDAAKASIQTQLALSGKNKSKPENTKNTAKVLEVRNLAHLKELLAKSTVPVVIDFYAPWCGPCKRIGGFLDGWAKELQGKVLLCKINIDSVSARDVLALYKVQSVPTFVEVDNKGSEVLRKVGTQDIIQYINQYKNSK